MSYGHGRDARHRVVITGMGVISVLGDSPEAFHASLVAGRSGITRWKCPRDDRHYSRIGGDLSDFDLGAYLKRNAARYPAEQSTRCLAIMRAAPLVPRLVAAAALQAWHDAGLGDSGDDV